MKVNVFVWKASQGQLSLVDRIIQAIQGIIKLEDIEFKIQDLSSFTPSGEDLSPVIVFGSMASSQIDEANRLVFNLPNLAQLEPTEENKETRISLAKKLTYIAQELKTFFEREEDSIESTVEIAEASVGIGLGDIQLAQAEIDNLLKIKQLLNGGTIVLKKGDIRIEIKDEQERK